MARLGNSALEGLAASIEFEQTKRSGEAIRLMRPASARWISVESRAAVRRVLGHRREAEVDDDEPAIADEQVLGLQVLVRNRLLLKVVEAREQILRKSPLVRGLR